MTRAKVILAVALAAACTATSLPSHAGARRVKESYVGSFDPLTYGRCRGSVPVNVGKVCIPVKSTDLRVTISIADQALPGAGFFYVMKNANGRCVGEPDDPLARCPNSDSVCVRRANILIPKRTVMLEVFVNGAVLGPFGCVVSEGRDGLGIGASGTITAAFVTK